MNKVSNLVLFVDTLILGAIFFPGFLGIISGGIVVATAYYLCSLLHVTLNLSMALFTYLILILAASALIIQKTRRSIFVNLSLKSFKQSTWLALNAIVLYVSTSIFVSDGIGWDSRSIWLLHAKWINAIEPYKNIQLDPIFKFSHPDYPISGSSTMSYFMNSLENNLNYIQGTKGLAYIQFCIIFYLSYLIANLVSRTGVVHTITIFVTFNLVSFQGGDYGITTGYMDLLSASIIATFAISLLTIKVGKTHTNQNLLLVIITIYGAGLKQETFYGLLIVFISFGATQLITREINYSFLYFILPGISIFLIWQLHLSTAGISSTSDASGIIRNMKPDSANFSLFIDYFAGYVRNGGFQQFMFAFLGLLLIWTFNRKICQADRYEKIFFTIFISSYQIFMIITYCFGNTRVSLEWWMFTSYDRIVMTPNIMMICAAILVVYRDFGIFESVKFRVKSRVGQNLSS
jgi:hypothetical protein